MLCPACEGKGCERCSEGQIEVTECPLEEITEDIWQTFLLAELYENGLPPVAGGSLDQAMVFVEAAGFIMTEKNYWKTKVE